MRQRDTRQNGAARWSRLTLATWMALALGLTTQAQAQDTAPYNPLQESDSGPVGEQLDMDVTVVPKGMGAVFVPSLTRARLEPSVLVYHKGDRVAVGRTGERIVVPPGEYTVVVGHGPVEQRPSEEVRVREGVTTPVPAFFAALRVTAVDRLGVPQPVSYTLRDAVSGARWGEEVTPTEGGYGQVKAWALPPGGVVLGLSGSDPGRDRITLPLSTGQNIRYRLVVDGDQLIRADLATRDAIARKTKWWRLRWVVGGDFSFMSTNGQLGSYNGEVWRAGLLTEAELGVDVGNHLALLNLSLDQSWLGIADTTLPTQKLVDEAEAELLYTYRWKRIIGPYGRAMARTTLFDTELTAEDDQEVVTRDGDGEIAERQTLAAGDALRLFDAFAPREFRQGVGLSLSLVDNSTVNFTLRGGGGARQALYEDGLFIEERSDGRIEAVRLADDLSVGLEAGVRAGLRLSQTLSLTIDADVYAPQAQIFEDDDLDPVYRIDNTLAMSVNSFVSVVYQFNVRKDAYEIEDPQLSNLLSLRLQHTLF